MPTALQTIQTLIRSLDRSTATNGVKALDAAIRSCSSYGSTQALVNDFIKKASAMRGRSDDDIKQFLLSKCGINLDNSDTGAITGYDANGSSVKTATSIIPETYSGGTIPAPYKLAYSFGKKGDHTYLIGKFQPYNSSGASGQLAGGLANWWIVGALRLVKNSYGLYFNKGKDSTDKKLNYIYFGYEFKNNTTRARTRYAGDHIEIIVNLQNYPNLAFAQSNDASGYSPNDKLAMDRLIAHEMTHAMFYANMNNSLVHTLPQFFTEGSAELVHGVDDDRKYNIINLLKGTTSLTSALSLKAGTGNTNAYAAGYMLLRYLAHQVKIGEAARVTGFSYANSNTLLKVGASYKGSTVSTYKAAVKKIDARKAKRKVSIYGNAKDNTIYASAKGGTLWGKTGNDILYGGNGTDTFRFKSAEGNDTVRAYQSNKDIISISGNLMGATVKGSNVVIIVDGYGLTIEKGKGKLIKVVDSNKKSSLTIFNGSADYNSSTGEFTGNGATAFYAKLPKGVTYNAKKTAASITASFKNSTYSLNAAKLLPTIRSINASKAKHGVSISPSNKITIITGSKYADTLNAGNGKATLNGGNGNDKLYGGTGTNILNGGNGHDILYGILALKNTMNGGNGNDKLFGGSGTSLMHGGNGNDSLFGGSGINTMYGDDGNDNLYGGTGTNKLYGGNGNDYLAADSGKISNYLYGGNGNDTLIGGAGTNTLRGGLGKDTLTGGEGTNKFFYGSLAEMAGDKLTNFKEADTLYFNLTSKDLNLDAIYQNYNLKGNNASGKNTISLHNNVLTITDKNKKKYSLTLSNSYSGNITIANKSGQSHTFTL